MDLTGMLKTTISCVLLQEEKLRPECVLRDRLKETQKWNVTERIRLKKLLKMNSSPL